MNYFNELGTYIVKEKSAIAAVIGNAIIYTALLTPRWKWWNYPLGCVLIVLSTPFLFSFTTTANHAAILAIIGYALIIFNLILFSDSPWKVLSFCFTISIINRLCTFLGFAVSAGFHGKYRLLSVFIVMSSIYLILAFVCWVWVRRFLRRHKHLTLRNYLWPLLFSISFIAKLLVDFFSKYVFDLNPTSDLSIIWSMTALCIFTLFLLVILLYNSVSAAMLASEKNISDHLNYELDIQRRQYETQLQSQQEVRRMKHDMNGHLITVIGLLQNGRQEEAAHYLCKITDMVTRPTEQIYADDPHINAVISSYASLFERNNIKFSSNIVVTPFGKYTVELCLIFSNALQNALEASLQLPPDLRSVTITAKIKFDYLILQIANRYAGTITLTDEALPTTTKDSTCHGYGLTSIKRTLEAMDGVLHLRTDNDTFILEATAKIK